MPYKRKYSKGPPSPGRVKRSSQAAIWKMRAADIDLDFPHVYYSQIFVCPPDRVARMMGMKITAYPSFSDNIEVATQDISMGFGLYKATDEEATAMSLESESDDQRRFRRCWARESTFVHDHGSSTTFNSSPNFAALVQSHVKGTVTLASGQALYMGAWAIGTGGGAAKQRSIAGVIEYSLTERLQAT